MFVAGIVGGAVVGVIAHSDHSRHYNYSEYSDADVQHKIKRKKAKLEKIRSSFKEEEVLARESLDNELNILKSEMDLKGKITLNNLNLEVEKKYKDLLEEAIADDQLKVNEIDKAINMILDVQLKKWMGYFDNSSHSIITNDKDYIGIIVEIENLLNEILKRYRNLKKILKEELFI